MGRVFLGWSSGGRPVAVKVIKAELARDAEFRSRFRREVEAARTISGLYTAVLYDADLDGPVPWLATAYVDGPSLAEAVASYGPLPAKSVLALAAGLAEALAAIHSAGLVHRDLKPSNVLLASDGPRVIDFGISRAADTTTLTDTGQSLGSPGYLSPEQAVGDEIGPPTDIFSLGAVLAFAASGNGPFGAGSLPALVYRVVHQSPTLEGVPAELRPLIERCLAKKPEDRPAAGDLLADLADVQPGAQWLPERISATLAAFAASAPPQPGLDSAPAPVASEVAANGSAPFDPTATSTVSPLRTPSAVTPADEIPPSAGASGRTTRSSWSQLLRRSVLVPVVSAVVAVAAVGVALAATLSSPGRTDATENGSPVNSIRPLAASGRPLTSAASTRSPVRSKSPAPKKSPSVKAASAAEGNSPPPGAPVQAAQPTPQPTRAAPQTSSPPSYSPPKQASPQSSAPSTPDSPPQTDPAPQTSPPPQTDPAPTPITHISWTGATDYSCGAEGSVSSAGTTPATLHVSDLTSYSIEEFWLNASGSPVFYATIASGGAINQPTYIGHVWMITNTAGQCEGIVSVGASAASVTIS